MRHAAVWMSLVLLVTGSGCGDDGGVSADASSTLDAAMDSATPPIDAPGGDSAVGDGSLLVDGSPIDARAADAGPPSSGFSSLVGGGAHTCGLAIGDEAFCWGRDDSGQLGWPASSGDQTIPVAVDTSALAVSDRFTSLSAGSAHTCGLTAMGVAFCWGQNTDGQLGVGVVSARSDAPVAVDASALPAGESFAMLAAGGTHTCALTTTGTAYCWGDQSLGRLGNGETLGNSPVPVPVDTTNVAGGTFATLVAGGDFTCGLTGSNVAYCWGYDLFGQVGDGGSMTNRPIPVAVDTSNLSAGDRFAALTAGGRHVCGLTMSGQAFCWGRDTDGDLGNGLPRMNRGLPETVDATAFAGEVLTALTSRGAHTCALATSGAAFCWGAGYQGQLGDGGLDVQDTPVEVMGLPAGEGFRSLAAGSSHTCGITTEGKAFCWGNNGNGRLGDGTTDDRAVPVLVDVSGLPAP